MTFGEMEKRMQEKIDDPNVYLNLAEYYLDKNVDLAYLSLENACFYETDESRKKDIHQMMTELNREGFVRVVPATFVILSYQNLDYIKACIESIRLTCEPSGYEIVVVDNGSGEEVVSYLKAQNDIKLILNEDNRGFPAGCNQGIEAASNGNDIFLLNDDTVMLPNSLFCLRMALYSDTKIGAVGAMGSNAPIDQKEPDVDTLDESISHALRNNIHKPSMYEKKIWLVGFALLIKNDVREKVGLLDERFSPGNYEDNDYCLRILEEGYQNILCHNCLIFHHGGGSFNKEYNSEKYIQLNTRNRERFNEKWGERIDYYTRIRKDLIGYIEETQISKEKNFRILECGCGMGATLLRIKYLYPNAEVYGVELLDNIVGLGKVSCNIVQGNIESLDLNKVVGEPVDYIVLGDVIEYLADPYKLLRKCRNVLRMHGHIIASIPNIMHYSVMIPLLKGQDRFQSEGIRDYTHFHNFTFGNIFNMFEQCGYDIEKADYQIVDRKSFKDINDKEIEWFQNIIKSEETAPEYQFNAYQYLICAKNIDDNSLK